MKTRPEPASAREARRRRPLAAALLVSALALPLVACSPPARPPDSPAPAPMATPAPSASPTVQAGVSKAPDNGDFKVAPRESGGAKDAEDERELAEEQKSLEETAADLNRAFSLPHDILIGFDECGEPNAFYDPEKKKVTVCDELVADFYDAFREDHKKESELDEAVTNATTFVFFHELGHALVDAYDLPVTGREEDAVDQLSVILLADGSEEGDQAVFDAALAFSKETDEELDELAFADEHSFDRQRFYNIICLLYGQNQEKYASLVREGTLPEARAERCADEFARADRAWDALLAPYVKEAAP